MKGLIIMNQSNQMEKNEVKLPLVKGNYELNKSELLELKKMINTILNTNIDDEISIATNPFKDQYPQGKILK